VQSLSIKLMDIFKQAYRKLARMMIQEVSSVIQSLPYHSHIVNDVSLQKI